MMDDSPNQGVTEGYINKPYEPTHGEHVVLGNMPFMGTHRELLRLAGLRYEQAFAEPTDFKAMTDCLRELNYVYGLYTRGDTKEAVSSLKGYVETFTRDLLRNE